MLVQIQPCVGGNDSERMFWVDPDEVMAISGPYGPKDQKVRRVVLRGGYSIYIADTGDNMDKLLRVNYAS